MKASRLITTLANPRRATKSKPRRRARAVLYTVSILPVEAAAIRCALRLALDDGGLSPQHERAANAILRRWR